MRAGFGGKLVGAALIAALSACAPSTGDGVFAPVGEPSGQASVDPLLVGHRLMVAGEYELARDSYLRAALNEGLSVEVLSGLGSVDLALGRLGQAETNLRKAIEVDEEFVPAWNNLGVVLMEQGNYGEARLVFQTAFALDSGKTESIGENLKLALAKIENPVYDIPNNNEFQLIRQGSGEFLLLGSP